MKENKYDNDTFFEKYSQMRRSKQGLQGAAEWVTFKNMLPDFKGKTVLDLGCGYGWHCIYAAEQGAASVTGIDISQKMLSVAKEKTVYKQVQYQCMALEDMKFEACRFDIVISSLALHYIESFEPVAEKVNQVLKTNGMFVFSVEHPVYTAHGSQDWYYDESGQILHFPVDRYFYEGRREATFLGEKVTKYHKTLTTYLHGLLSNGFEILDVAEPQPPENMLDLKGMQDELRRPMMLIISAKKR